MLAKLSLLFVLACGANTESSDLAEPAPAPAPSSTAPGATKKRSLIPFSPIATSPRNLVFDPAFDELRNRDNPYAHATRVFGTPRRLAVIVAPTSPVGPAADVLEVETGSDEVTLLQEIRLGSGPFTASVWIATDKPVALSVGNSNAVFELSATAETSVHEGRSYVRYRGGTEGSIGGSSRWMTAIPKNTHAFLVAPLLEAARLEHGEKESRRIPRPSERDVLDLAARTQTLQLVSARVQSAPRYAPTFVGGLQPREQRVR